MKSKHLNVLGSVSRQFVVTPELDTLLSAMEASDSALSDKLEDETLIRMDNI